MSMIFWWALSALALFFFGATLGSFLHVLIERSIEGKDWVRGRSRCDTCGHQLAWYDNIPLLSFLWLRGRCRYCGASIDIGHLLLELLTGTLFVWWFFGGFILLNVFRLTHQPFTVIQPLFWLLVAVLLLIIFVYDAKYFIIPDGAVWLLLVVTLAYRLVLVGDHIMQPIDLIWSLVAAALAVGFFSLLWLVTLGRGLGLGDLKLVIPLSLLVGWQLTAVGLILSFLIGSVVNLGLLLLNRVKFGRPIPFGPYLVVAFSITLILGDTLLSWYLSML